MLHFLLRLGTMILVRPLPALADGRPMFGLGAEPVEEADEVNENPPLRRSMEGVDGADLEPGEDADDVDGGRRDSGLMPIAARLRGRGRSGA